VKLTFLPPKIVLLITFLLKKKKAFEMRMNNRMSYGKLIYFKIRRLTSLGSRYT